MPGRRGRAISALAQRVIDGGLDFSDHCDSDQLHSALEAIPGIGPWTINYIKLRVVKDPDAFPHNDWVVLKQLQTTPKSCEASRRMATLARLRTMYIWYAAMTRRQQGSNK